MRLVVTAVLLVACGAATPTTPSAPSSTALAQLEATRDLAGTVVGASDAPATIVIVFATWCEHCRDEIVELDAIRTHRVRLIAANYRGHEEYDHRGNSAAVSAFASATPWLRVVPIDDQLFDALGRPPLIPTMFVYDHSGALVATFDRRTRKPPTRDELITLLAKLGA
jgi:hypothetical protein